MLLILLKTSLVLMILLAFYKLVLERESFFVINRFYLLAALVLAFVLPFVSIPELIDHQGYVDTVFKSKQEFAQEFNAGPSPASFDLDDANQSEGFDESMEQIDEKNESFDESKAPLAFNNEASNDQTDKASQPLIVSANKLLLKDWLLIIYLFGAIVMLLNIFAQVFNTLRKVYRSEDKIAHKDYTIVNMNTESEPCSFFRYIFINPTQFDYDTYEQILAHEQIHVQKKHSIDLLISELAVVLMWFNPFAWIFRKEVEKNIEYQTDALLTGGPNEEKEFYQMNLLRIATYNKPLAITTNYNQSLIKQRILKINAKRSNPYSYWKYTFMLPVLFVSLLLINEPKSSLAAIESGAFFEGNEFDAASINGWEEGNDLENEFGESESHERLDRNLVADDAEDRLTQELIDAVHRENIEIIKILLENGAKANSQLNNGWTPLMEAASVGNLEIGQLLLEEGADIDTQDNQGFTALMAAIHESRGKFANFLIDNKADISLKTNNGWNHLMEAANHNQIEVGQLLIEKGLDAKDTDNEGWSALTEASSKGDQEFTELLLANGANINQRTRDGRTPLMVAVHKGHLEMASFLIKKGADINSKTEDGWTLLMEAIDHSHTEMSINLIELGAAINAQNNSGWTPLFEAVEEDELEIVQLLIKRGAKINHYARGTSALQLAIHNGSPKMVEFLLSRGAKSFSASDADEEHVQLDIDEEDILQHLNDHGHSIDVEVSIDDRENADCKALLLASKNSDVEGVRKALKNADPNCIYRRIGEPRTALVAAGRQGNLIIGKLLVNAGADIELYANGDESPLMAAANGGHLEFVKYLIGKGAKINKKVSGNGTALIVAANGGHKSVVQYLLEKGADVNAMVGGDGTALINAVRGGHLAVAEVLLKAGADPFQVAPGDEYAMYHARVNDDDRMIKLLKKYDNR